MSVITLNSTALLNSRLPIGQKLQTRFSRREKFYSRFDKLSHKEIPELFELISHYIDLITHNIILLILRLDVIVFQDSI